MTTEYKKLSQLTKVNSIHDDDLIGISKFNGVNYDSRSITVSSIYDRLNRANWDSVHSTVNTNSGAWDNTKDLLNANKDNWDSVHSTVTSNSGAWSAMPGILIMTTVERLAATSTSPIATIVLDSDFNQLFYLNIHRDWVEI
jgi:hypothetical protein